MNLLDLQRKLIRLSGNAFVRGSAGFEAAPPEPKARQFAGLRVMVENPAGSTRSGISRTGQRWAVRMNNDYGFLPRATGADGEGLDVFLGPDENAPDAYVVHQNDPWSGRYDEDKVMLGFRSPEEAKAAYLSNYDRPGFFRSMTILPMAAFRGMLTNGEAGGVQWKRKHGREHAAAAMFAAGEGRWVTIGSNKEAPKGEKGGTPVYIGKDGTIEAGPQKLEGRNVSNLKEPAKPKGQQPQGKPAAASKVQPLTYQQLHERVKALRAQGKPTDLAVAQARRESQRPQRQQAGEVQGGPHAEIEAQYGPPPGQSPMAPTESAAAPLAGPEAAPVQPEVMPPKPKPYTHPKKHPYEWSEQTRNRYRQHNDEQEKYLAALVARATPRRDELVQGGMELGDANRQAMAETEAALGHPGEFYPPAREGSAKPEAEAPAPAAEPAAQEQPAAAPEKQPKEKAARAPKGEPSAIPPDELRRRILERYEQENGRGIPEEAWDLVKGMQDPWTFARSAGQKGERNTMLREGGKEGAAMALSGAVKVAEHGGAEDAIGALKDHYGPEGEDLYWRMAKARSGSGFDDALKYARTHEDPQMRFLAALHDITPARKGERVAQDKVQADQLPIDHEFTIQDVPVKVTENEDGEKVLVDHDALPETPVDALGEVPVDKGSMKESELPNVGSAGDDPFGDLPPEESPPAEPEQQAVPEPTDAGDRKQDQPGDELGKDTTPGAGHDESVPDLPAGPSAGDSPASPTSDTGVFGQEILRPATGKNQGGLFHEPVQVEGPERETVGSKEANRPEHTAQMFPAKPAEPTAADGASVIPAKGITPLHGIIDPQKLKLLTSEMKAKGWKGRPLLVVKSGKKMYGLTGSHRAVAAKRAGVEVPVKMIDVDALETAGIDLGFLRATDDVDKEYKLRRAGFGEAADLLESEINANESNS